MTDVIGKGIIQIEADSTKLRAGVSSAKTSLEELRASAKEAGESLTSSSTGYLRSLERQTAAIEKQAATFGQSKAEIASYNAAQQGVSGTAATMIERLATAETSLKSQSAAAKLAALAANSFGTASAAAGDGMAQLNFQSGGAVRGVVGLVRALEAGNFPRAGASIVSLSTRVGLAGAVFSALGLAVVGTIGAIAAFAVAAAKGAAETGNYNKALILSGNYAGTTASQMSDMAKAISQSGGTQGKAAEVLTQLAGSGKVAAAQFEAITLAAIAMERAGGPAAKTIVDEMTKLGGAPYAASVKLNESTHFLTLALVEQIKALEDQGHVQDAAALAQQAGAAATAKAAADITANLGTMQRGWNLVKDAAKAAWDAMANVGRQASDADTLTALRTSLAAAQTRIATAGAARGPAGPSQAAGGVMGTTRSADVELASSLAAQIKIVEARSAGAAAAAATKAADDGSALAMIKVNAQLDQYASKAEKMKKELATTTASFDTIRAGAPSEARTAALEKEKGLVLAIQASYKETAKPEKPVVDDAATKMLATLHEQNAAFIAQLETDDKLTTSEKARAVFAQMIDDLAGKKLTKDQASLLAGKAEIFNWLDKNIAAQKSVDLKIEDGKQQAKNAEAAKVEAERLKKANADSLAFVVALNRTIASAAEGRAQQYDAKLSVVGLGSQAAEQLASTKAIYAEALKEQKAFTTEWANGRVKDDDYATGTANIKAGLADALAANKDYYAKLAVLQKDWKNGAKSAVADYLTDAANVAKQTNNLFSKAFQGMEDALVTFVTTGKLSFSSLAQSILADLARIIIKQQMAAMLTAAIGATGGAGGWLGLLTGLGGGGGGSGVIAGGGGITLGGVSAGGAIGGDFAANSLTTVNEHGPEMLRVGNRDMLMMGSQPGHITPVGQFGAPGGVTINVPVAAGVSRNELAAMVPALKAQIKAELMATMRRPGYQRV